MTDFRYVIIGGGMTADAAARGIRECDADGSVAIISNDVEEPYTRPALSKRLWTDGEFSRDDNRLDTAAVDGVQIFLQTEATRVDVEERSVKTTSGEFGFDKLLFATGGRPKTIDLDSGERVIYFRDFADYRRLRALSGKGRRIAVIGGGFIGTELASALAQNSTDTTLIFDDEILGASVFPADLAERFHQLYIDHGVGLVPGTKVSAGRTDSDRVILDCGGDTHTFDAVAVGLGITPSTRLAEAAGLDVDDGIVVDASLRTSAPNVFAAGDVASYPDAILGRQRVEHVDNATQMGAAAGRIMAGADETYTHTPYFYTNVFDFGYRAVGTLDPDLLTVEDWGTPHTRGAVFYLSDDRRVRGVLTLGLDDELDAARTIISEDWAHSPGDLVHRLTSSA
ncbi:MULTISPECIES: NAD(P)/FAD-dependent oxidoreductase [unclassified Brevibacterium]|uniref:NAD(P)/FAD-dependent oxidoreductase n=1 Tax=unclassified Brevibacterium TaxID=2614124 RepID=UPI001091D687|nr:FAD/NAD(P)-binding oxidoreductase [Brevibacterium sp. S22]TGD29155.1 NAD(P)/FAD-dependent oxidoreductase [Brevibacterium sp. S22]